MKKSQEEQKHFTQRRKALEGAKETKQLFFAILCALASLREIVYFFTVSAVVGIASCYQFSPRQRATESPTAADYLCPPFRGSSLVLLLLPHPRESTAGAQGEQTATGASSPLPVKRQASSLGTMNNEWLKRITVEEGKCGGRPCIRGLRIRVSDVLELLAAGASFQEILSDYPALEREDIIAAIEYAAHQTDHAVLQAS